LFTFSKYSFSHYSPETFTLNFLVLQPRVSESELTATSEPPQPTKATLKGPGAPQKHDGSSLRIAIVHARWNTTIINALVSGCQNALLASGVRHENIVVESVPGAYELPFAVQRVYAASQIQSTTSTIASGTGSLISATTDLLGSTGSLAIGAESAEGASKTDEGGSKQAFDAVIAIGVLIKGETMHFEYIADATSQGLMRVQLDSGVPVIFGLLTVLSEEQGLARAGLEGGTGKEAKGHNHGEDWGNAAVELGVKRKGWAEGKISGGS
jgi:6,7-dimethyl-8-ribityllumazine synthase